jgi:response regulator NasT
LVADDDEEHLLTLARVVEDLGHTVSAHAVGAAEAAVEVADKDPDLAVVALHRDRERALAIIGEIAASASFPVIAALRTNDREFVRLAAERGVDAYVQPLTPARLRDAIEIAGRRRAERDQLARRVGELEGAFERRAVIERAKGILMERHGIDEQEAFELLREEARSRRTRVAELAHAVSEGHALLPGNGR